MPITIKRARTTVDLCQNLGLVAEYQEVGAALDQARKEGNGGMEVDAPRLAAAKRMRELEDVMRESTLVFTIEALSGKAWNEFVAANPPREGNDDDATYELNTSKLDAVILDGIVEVKEKVSGENHPFDPATEWSGTADEITNGQWREFAQAALAVNRGVTAAPFSQIALRETLRSGATSN